MIDCSNLTLLTDLYQLTMMNGYLQCGKADEVATFDLFYRKNGKDFAVAAGLEQAIDYINNLKFEEKDIAYLAGLNLFPTNFFDSLRSFKFTGSIRAVQEGEIIFPQEPILTVTARLFEAQLVETALLNILNHQTLIATKAFRIVSEARGAVAEFGLRRAQGPDAGLYGARAAMIAGCAATSNVLAGKKFEVKVTGTHAHSWVMSFDNELQAFMAYADAYPDSCLLLVDTYDTLKSGVPNAIKVFDYLVAKGHSPVGIRLDSGDLAYLSKQARAMLDAAGHTSVKIYASGDIDEEILRSLYLQGAKIDVWGIGTKLITSYDNPSLGGVYKMSATYANGVESPKMKVSDAIDKITNPGNKTTYRIYDEHGFAAADLIALRSEHFDTSQPLTIFHPIETYKKKTFETYCMRDLMIDVFKDGKQVYFSPSIKEIAEYHTKVKAEFYEENIRITNPHIYKVDLSDGLYELKNRLIHQASQNIKN